MALTNCNQNEFVLLIFILAFDYAVLRFFLKRGEVFKQWPVLCGGMSSMALSINST
jgi:hypothetical protein